MAPVVVPIPDALVVDAGPPIDATVTAVPAIEAQFVVAEQNQEFPPLAALLVPPGPAAPTE
jgi:hypothetical protein